MRIHIASDHAGFELKRSLEEHLTASGHHVVNHGAFAYDPLDDYPAFCFDCAAAVVNDPGSLGVVIGGSGNGEQIAANKVRGARAALVWSPRTARLARQHNDANLAGLGAREHTEAEALAIIDAFIAEAFSGDERHQRRVDLLTAYEARAC